MIFFASFTVPFRYRWFSGSGCGGACGEIDTK
jgi:hypothetical protein